MSVEGSIHFYQYLILAYARYQNILITLQLQRLLDVGGYAQNGASSRFAELAVKL
jgi:hypothetical protein